MRTSLTIATLILVTLLIGSACPAGEASSDLASLRAAVARRPTDAAAHFALGSALPLPERKEEALEHLEKAITLKPSDLHYANEFRRVCVRLKEYQRSIGYFEKEVTGHPDVASLHLNLAMAYVDKMPIAELGIVGEGLLSNRSIRELDKVLEKDPQSWPAIYGRAMNHLHWPKALLHASQAVEDFKSCLRLQQGLPAGALKPHHLLPYLGLGDAYVKNDQIPDARRTWKEAQKFFPIDSRLKHRLTLGDEDLKKFVDEERGLAKPIDTDLSFLWNE